MDKTTELPNDVNDPNRIVWNENEIQLIRAFVSDDNVIQFLLYNGRTYYPRDNTTEEPAPPSASATQGQAPPSASATQEQAPPSASDTQGQAPPSTSATEE